MKKLLVPLVILLVCSFIISACSSGTTTTPAKTTAAPPPATTAVQPPATTAAQPPATTAAPPPPTTSKAPAPPTTTTAAPAPTTSPPAAGQPVSGGILRIISPSGPQALGGFTAGPLDMGFCYPASECLLDASKDRTKGTGLVPVLAQSVDDDIANKRIVFHLRPNVKFSDGSPLNADVVLWTVQRQVDAGRLQYQSYYKGIKKLDDMTVEMDYTQYTNQLLPELGMDDHEIDGSLSTGIRGRLPKKVHSGT